MTGLIIVGCILLALLLFGQLRVGAAAAWSESGLSLKIKAGPVHIQVLPQKKKERPPKPPEKHPAEEGAKPASRDRKKDRLSLALRFLPLLAEAAGRFKRKIRIDRLKLHVIWGAADPAAAAQGFGAGNAVLGMLWPLLEHNFNVKEHDLRVDVDFEQKSPTLTADAQATLTVGQCLNLAVCLGVKALKIYLGFRREQNEEKAVQA